MADADTPVPGRPKGSETAAILLMVIGQGEAAEVLRRLDPGEVQQLGSAMFGVADVNEGQVEAVFDEFISRAKASTAIGFGAAPRIRAVMEHALGPERAENVLARITPPTRSTALDSLRWMDAKTIAALVEQEHPQIAALVLAHLDPPIAADVLQLLPAAMQPDVVYRTATLESVTPEALDELERLLVLEVARSTASPWAARGGAGEVAKIMNNLRPGADEQIMRALGKLDKTLAQTIRDEMFVFHHLMDVDDKSLGTLLRAVENDVLVLALKGADPALRKKCFGCMSARAATTIEDEIEERGPVRLAEVLDAQKEILATARRLADAGTIMLAHRGNDYV